MIAALRGWPSAGWVRAVDRLRPVWALGRFVPQPEPVPTVGATLPDRRQVARPMRSGKPG